MAKLLSKRRSSTKLEHFSCNLRAVYPTSYLLCSTVQTSLRDYINLIFMKLINIYFRILASRDSIFVGVILTLLFNRRELFCHHFILLFLELIQYHYDP